MLFVGVRLDGGVLGKRLLNTDQELGHVQDVNVSKHPCTCSCMFSRLCMCGHVIALTRSSDSIEPPVTFDAAS